VNSDIEIEIETDDQQTVEAAIATDSDIAPQIRSSISNRVDELTPFIDQGNGDYAVAVIDEMLSLTDLTETEATYLLNLRAKAETASGFMTESTSLSRRQRLKSRRLTSRLKMKSKSPLHPKQVKRRK